LLERAAGRLRDSAAEELHFEQHALGDTRERASSVPRKSISEPRHESIRSAVLTLRAMPETESLGAAAVAALYGIESVPAREFVRSSKYVARAAIKRSEQLPRRTMSRVIGQRGRYASASLWSRDEVLTAALGWAARLGVDVAGPF